MKHKYSTKLKNLVVHILSASLAFCIGMMIGFCLQPSRVEYVVEKQEVEDEEEIVLSQAQVFDAAPVEEEPEPEPEPVLTYHGSCRITAYDACESCCGEWANNRPLDENGNPIVYGASGIELTPGVSVACSLPYGTKIMIDGLDGVFVVEDRTAEWIQDKYNGMTVDIYMDSHEACYELLAGMPEWMDVYIVEE